MSGQSVIGGVLVSPIVVACVIALLATATLSLVLMELGFYRLVWHRPLAEVAIFFMALAVASCLPFVGVAP